MAKIEVHEMHDNSKAQINEVLTRIEAERKMRVAKGRNWDDWQRDGVIKRASKPTAKEFLASCAKFGLPLSPETIAEMAVEYDWSDEDVETVLAEMAGQVAESLPDTPEQKAARKKFGF